MKINSANRAFLAAFLTVLLLVSLFPTAVLAKSKPPECVRTVDKKYVCLTIDDGWGKKTITGMLDALQEI